MAYVYRGKHTIAAEEAEAQDAADDEQAQPQPKPKAECGTISGYTKHVRDRTPTCEDCKRAHTEYKREWRMRGHEPRPYMNPCGTRAAYHRHKRRKETPCAPCAEAHREYMLGYHERRHQLTPDDRAKGNQARIEAANSRIEELETLIHAGEPIIEAVARVGWPTVSAAAATLWRRKHPLAKEVERVRREVEKAA